MTWTAEQYRVWYEKNKVKVAERGRAYRLKNQDKIRATRIKNRDRKLRQLKKWQLANQKQIKEYNERTKKVRYGKKRSLWRRYRLAAIERVGKSKCTCCGETHVEFLTLDHRNGGGRAHRRGLAGSFSKSSGSSGSYHLYQWCIYGDLRQVRREMRVLCWNCNCSIGAFGFCPHNPKKKTAEVHL